MTNAEQVVWPEGFFELSGDARLRTCATMGCGQHVSIRMERGGIGSDFCEPCARDIVSALHAMPPARGTPPAPAEQVMKAYGLRRTFDQWRTAPNDKPCPMCGGEPEGPDKCTGADLRVMGKAADELEALRTRLAEVEKARDAAETKRLAAWKDWRKLIDAILEPSPMCRDCADAFGTCPASGLPCDTTDKAIAIHNRKKARAETAEADAAKLRETLTEARRILVLQGIMLGLGDLEESPLVAQWDELLAGPS